LYRTKTLDFSCLIWGKPKERRRKRKKRKNNEDGRTHGQPLRERVGRGTNTVRRERERERWRRRPTELLAMGHSVLAMGLAMTHDHPLQLTLSGVDSHIL
jgi:hypothetical protein